LKFICSLEFKPERFGAAECAPPPPPREPVPESTSSLRAAEPWFTLRTFTSKPRSRNPNIPSVTSGKTDSKLHSIPPTRNPPVSPYKVVTNPLMK
ncbi:hypothetical protein JYU34_014363, partial [Plutella xylostella]